MTSRDTNIVKTFLISGLVALVLLIGIPSMMSSAMGDSMSAQDCPFAMSAGSASCAGVVASVESSTFAVIHLLGLAVVLVVLSKQRLVAARLDRPPQAA